MIFDNNKHNFDLFMENWSPDDNYVIYGASKDAPRLIQTMDHILTNHNLKVSHIIDDNENSKILYNYPIGSVSDVYKFDQSTYIPEKFVRKKYNQNIEIVRFEKYLSDKNINKNKIIIASDYNYKFYKQLLESKGLKEDKNFCNYKKIAAIWPYKLQKLTHLWRTDVLLTEKCTLNCTFCNMYMPHYDKQKHRDFEEIKLDIDIYFKRVDYVSVFHLIGGEPLLYPYAAQVIDYVSNNYREKIGYFFLTTNGTITPKDTVLNSIKNNNLVIHISDYTDHINYGRKFNQTKSNFDKYGIKYLVRNDTSWTDFGDPKIEKFKELQETIDHFDNCSAPFRGLNKLKYYYCHLNTSAVLSKMHSDDENNFIDLNSSKFNAEELLKLDLGFPKLGYVTFCKFCYGCNTKLGKKVSPKDQGLRH
tara:strand:- start:625 stop:1878 length:1254 start_codon:yes stop_codon:yes gene_type:complete